MALEWDANPEDIARALSAGLKDAGKILEKESNLRSPTDTGAMDDTSYVSVEGLDGQVGYTSAVAPIQHEKTWFKHKPGEQAKFLETALSSKQDEMLEAIADRVKDALS